MKKMLFALSLVGIGALTVGFWASRGKNKMEPIELLKVRIYNGKTLPDPADVAATSAWYMLGHISSGLIGYDYKVGQFEPLLAAPWKIEGAGKYTFELKPNARFHDGTPIKAQDVEASIKRILIKRSSTHFHLWEYLEDCADLKKMTDTCGGMRVVSDRVIEFQLKFRISSFLLQLATPETGIWSKDDIDPITLELKPNKFSGPYYVEKIDDGAFHLKINPYSPVAQAYPTAPKAIDVERISIAKGEEEILNGRIDVLIRGQKPMGEKNWEGSGLALNKSAPSSLLYFHSTDAEGKKQLVGKELVKALWAAAPQAGLGQATGVMPFKQNYTLDSEMILDLLPEKSASHIKVAIPDNKFFSEVFLDLIKDAGNSVHVKIDFVPVSIEQYLGYFKNLPDNKIADFVLGFYDVTERFPAVQLRFITGQRKILPPVDLKQADIPDMAQSEVEILKKYQMWLVEKGLAVPLFFAQTYVIHKKSVAFNEQAFSAGDVELWRFKQSEGN